MMPRAASCPRLDGTKHFPPTTPLRRNSRESRIFVSQCCFRATLRRCLDGVDFGIGEDAVALSAALGEFFDRRGDGRAIVDTSAADGGATRDRWEALCEIGIPGLRVPEPLGIGARLLDSTAVAERFGAVLLPEPASAAIVLAPARTALLDGAKVPCLASHHAVTSDLDGTLTGRLRIADDDITDLIAVPVSAGLAFVDRSAARAVIRRSDVDPSRPSALCDVEHAVPAETVPMTHEAIATLVREWAVLLISELVGGMHAVLDTTIAYAQERKQFGRSIGSFQAIKHQLADMYVAVEQARAAVQFAAIGCDDAAATASADVAAAARWVPNAAISLFERAIHLHGAMGYSWEGVIHLHLRRAMATRTLLRESSVTSPQSRELAAS
jgi:alkylation response protein AidB-like acyl-CoA dehydrogenase